MGEDLSWEEYGAIQLHVVEYRETGERYVSVKSLIEWLSIVKGNMPELSSSIDFLIRQLVRESHPVH